MANRHSLLAALIGTWDLQEFVAFDGQRENVQHPLGENAVGRVIYKHEGYMSATILQPGQLPYKTGSSGNPDTPSLGPGDGTEEDLVETSKNIMTYTGPFDIEELDGKLVLAHEIEIMSYPNWKGTSQIRVPELKGDFLVLTLPKPITVIAPDGSHVVKSLEVTWKRMPRHDPDSKSRERK